MSSLRLTAHAPSIGAAMSAPSMGGCQLTGRASRKVLKYGSRSSAVSSQKLNGEILTGSKARCLSFISTVMRLPLCIGSSQRWPFGLDDQIVAAVGLEPLDVGRVELLGKRRGFRQ